jgi:hypothetical protein
MVQGLAGHAWWLRGMVAQGLADHALQMVVLRKFYPTRLIVRIQIAKPL